MRPRRSSQVLGLLGILATATAAAQVQPAPVDMGQTPDQGDGGSLAPVPLPRLPGTSAPDGGAAIGHFGPPPEVQAPSGSPVERAAWLTGQLDGLLGDPALAGARTGLAVIDLETNKVLYARNETQPFNPASNVKLFTTAAALALLGPEFRGKTQLAATGPIVGGELRGDLVVVGRGDPSLVIEHLWRITATLWSQGIRRVTGRLVIDDTYFDEVRVGPGFEQKNEDLPFRSPSGALSLNYNAVGVHVRPGSGEGAPARVIVDPATPYFAIVNEARTVTDGRTALVIESRELAEQTQIVVRGTIARGDAGQTALKRVAHPDLYTAHALADLLRRRGIKVAGPIEHGVVPPGARVLVTHWSEPLSVIARDCNKRSNNFMAEQILKTLGAETGGAPGSWPKGVDAVATFLERIGIPRGLYRMTNGSGLYDANRFTPAQLVALLRVAYRDFRFAADFVASLAVAGTDGTVERRMNGALAERYVRAKTGTLQGVSCLAGYAGIPARAPLAFAVFMNDLADRAGPRAKQIQDRIAEALVTYLLAK